jgi:hypothetical protein
VFLPEGAIRTGHRGLAVIYILSGSSRAMAISPFMVIRVSTALRAPLSGTRVGLWEIRQVDAGGLSIPGRRRTRSPAVKSRSEQQAGHGVE